MSWRARFFGKRVEGQALVKLVEFMGENPKIRLVNRHVRPNWTTYSIGKCRMVPEEDGIHVDLHLDHRAYHLCATGDTIEKSIDREDIQSVVPYNS